MTTATAPAASSIWPRRLYIPLFAIGVPALVMVLIQVWFHSERLSEEYPEVLFPLFITFQLSTLVGLLALAVWFLFLGGLRLWTKLGVIALILAGVATVAGITRRVEFAGTMAPVFVFNWQPDVQAELQNRLSQAPTSTATLPAANLAIAPDDFPRYRGPAADGVAAAVTLNPDWEAHPPKVLWRTPVGWAYSGIAVAGKVAITVEQRDTADKEEEAVVCYDRATGAELWHYAYPAKFKQSAPMGGNGPRSTPTIADGDVYSLGALGDLVCLNGADGKLRWSVNIVKDAQAKVVQWGMTSSPLIVGDLVVVNAGIDPDNNQHMAVVAYERKSGSRAWAAGEHKAGYSSPMLATLAGVPQILLFDGGGLAGIAPADGKELWRYPWITQFEMNTIQPLVLDGDRVLISSEQSNGSAVLHIKKSGSAWSVDPVWANRNLAARFANPVLHAGYVYGLHNGALECIDVSNGARKWKSASEFESGQLLISGKTLLVQGERSGEIVAVTADPAGYHELGRIKVFRGNRTWNTPALAGRQLFVRNHEEMVALELP